MSSSRGKMIEDRISEFADSSIEFAQSEQKRENRLKKKMSSLTDHIIGIPKGEKGGNERIFKQKIAENTTNRVKYINLNSERIPNMIKANNFTQRHIIIKLLKTKERKILKEARENTMIVDFLSETREARKK